MIPATPVLEPDNCCYRRFFGKNRRFFAPVAVVCNTCTTWKNSVFSSNIKYLHHFAPLLLRVRVEKTKNGEGKNTFFLHIYVRKSGASGDVIENNDNKWCKSGEKLLQSGASLRKRLGLATFPVLRRLKRNSLFWLILLEGGCQRAAALRVSSGEVRYG